MYCSCQHSVLELPRGCVIVVTPWSYQGGGSVSQWVVCWKMPRAGGMVADCSVCGAGSVTLMPTEFCSLYLYLTLEPLQTVVITIGHVGWC
jgi:hypothetical protein